jgi:hypothetical protein
MQVLLNGSAKSLTLYKGADATVGVALFNNDGSLLDITGGQVDLLVYDRSDRANTAIATHVTDTLVTPTAGYATNAIADSAATWTPGEYFVFARLTDSTSKVFYSQAVPLFVR